MCIASHMVSSSEPSSPQLITFLTSAAFSLLLKGVEVRCKIRWIFASMYSEEGKKWRGIQWETRADGVEDENVMPQ